MIIGHPGTWQQFQSRSDNRNLSIMEMKSKYLREQYLFEAQMLNLQQLHQQNAFMNGVGGGSLPSSEPVIPNNLITFQFLDIGAASIELGFDVTQIPGWNNIFSKTFTYINVDNNIVTIGGAENITFFTDQFSGTTTIERVIDVNNNTIRTIEDGAFQDSLVATIIANYVISIGSNVFNGCSSFIEASFASDCTYGNDVFLNVSTSGTITVNTNDYTDPNIQYLETTKSWIVTQV